MIMILNSELIFDNYGYYKYIQYFNDKKHIIIENNGLKVLKKKYINDFIFEKTEYNILSEKKTTQKYDFNIYPCLLM